MKSFLTAILLSFILVLIYSFIALYIVPSMTGDSMKAIASMWEVPLQYPQSFIDNFAPESLQSFFRSTSSGSVLLEILVFLGNVFLFTIPVYIILSILRLIKNQMVNSDY